MDRRFSVVSLFVVILLSVSVLARKVDIDAAVEYCNKNELALIDDLVQLARIPTVSALSQHQPDFVKAAAWLQKRLSKAGLQNAKLLPTGNQPSVYAEWLQADNEALTVLIYAHYDVQPADPLDAWDTPPFEPTIIDGTVYGRGVDDCKGTLLQPVQAVEAVLRTAGRLPINVKFLLEGQEEVGSPDLPALLEQHQQLLQADVVLSADGGQASKTQGSIWLGLRGAVAMEVQLSTLTADVHSGLWGGTVVNPALALARLLATLHNPDGSIAVQGYYDDVRAMTPEDKADAGAFWWDEDRELGKVGALGSHGEEGFSTIERTWHRPCIDVVGMFSGHTDEGVKTIIPASATAKISSRLVPDQDPQRVLQLLGAHLTKHAPQGANVTLRPLGFAASPYHSQRDTLGNRAAAKVLEVLLGSKAKYMRSGGTIPALALLKQQLGVDTTVFAFGLPDDRIHAPNERYPLDFFALGREAYVHMLFALAQEHQRAGGASNVAASAGGMKEEL